MQSFCTFGALSVLHICAASFVLHIVIYTICGAFLYCTFSPPQLVLLINAAHMLHILCCTDLRTNSRKYPIGDNIPNWVFQISECGYFIHLGIGNLFSDSILPDFKIPNSQLGNYHQVRIYYPQ